MTFQIHVVAITDDGPEQLHEITSLQRTELRMETLGLTLAGRQSHPQRDPACHRGSTDGSLRGRTPAVF